MNSPLVVTRYVGEAARDIRIAIRRMRQEPALTAAILVTIGLGLGATAAISTVFKAAIIQPPPFAEPRQLVHVWEQRSGTTERTPTSWPTFTHWRARDMVLSGLEGYNPSNLTVGVDDDARMLRGAQVTTGFFQLLGVRMSAGRGFRPGEEAALGGVAVVSRRFADAALAGDDAPDRTIRINGAPVLIVGVLPASFHFAPLQDADIWVPLVADNDAREDWTDRWISVVGRLRAGATTAAAQAQLSTVMAELALEYPGAMRGRNIVVATLRDALLGNVKVILMSLAGGVALLLVTVTTNLALLMLTRYLGRQRELAMRTALGATRARLHRQLFAESLVLAAGGFALALALGETATRLLLATIPEGVRIDMPYLDGAGLDIGTIAFVAGAAALLALTFGIGPAVMATRSASLNRKVRYPRSRSDRRLRSGLVVTQIALTVVLLVAAALLLVSFRNLLRNELGFSEPRELVSVRVPLAGERYATPEAQQRFFEILLERMAAVPGVRNVAAISQLPLGGGGITGFEAVDQPAPASEHPRAALRMVAGDYFPTMRIPLIAGRTFEVSDRADAQPVAVVSARLGELLSSTGASTGRRIRLPATGDAEWEVVGIVGDVQTGALDADSPPAVYVSHLQLAENRMSLVVRTDAGAGPIADAARAIVRSLDPAVPVYGVSTLEQRMNESRAVFSRRFPMVLCVAFAMAALTLALVALYSLSAHNVLTRRREFGIRLALGAAPADVRGTVLRTGGVLAALGAGIGVIAALPASRALRALLFGVNENDWRVYGVVAVGVVATALLATIVPALRAGSVSPSSVMRSE